MNLADFLASTGGLAVKAALAAAFLDFAFGVFGAISSSTFAFDAIAAFVRKHILGRVAPISVLAYVGFTTGDAIMTASAAAALTAYAAETLASIYGSIQDAGAAKGTPAIPED